MAVARSMFSPGVPAELNRKIVAEVAKYRDDPLGFVQFAFPWGQKGTPLERWPGPQMWQAQRLIEIGAALEHEERLEIEGEAEWVDEPLADVPDDMKGLI